ncbi:MAG: CpaE family protein [Thiohalorhabdus sp.]|uniref:AAA family ATPase n=1 Tax=Thiohalorhabdus sp. TaxID=3094134 RepID=UPI003980296E
MISGLKVLALLADPATAREVHEAAQGLEGVDLDLRMVGPEGAMSHIEVAAPPPLILLEIDTQEEGDLQQTRELVATVGDRANVFVTYAQGDLRTLRTLMRAGVRDVLPQPELPDQLARELEALLASERDSLRAGQAPRGKAIAFLNAKGGAGATTIATNVAYHLAAGEQAKVAILDLDLQFGAVAMSLNLRPERTIQDAVEAPERVDPLFLNALMSEHASGLRVLAAPASPQVSGEIPGEAARAILAAALEGHDYVVLDVPRVLNPLLVTILATADPVYLVAQQNLATLHDARTTLDGLSHLGARADRVQLLLNRVRGKRLGDIREEDIPALLGREIDARLHNDFETANRAQTEGRPVAEVKRQSPLARDLQALARGLTQSSGAAPASAGNRRRGGSLWNLLRR